MLNYDNSPRSNAQDSKLRTVTCNYLYKELFKRNIYICSFSIVVGFSRHSSCILFKGGGKRGHIVAHDVSWVGKRAGHKTFVLCPCRANGKTFVADTKCF